MTGMDPFEMNAQARQIIESMQAHAETWAGMVASHGREAADEAIQLCGLAIFLAEKCREALGNKQDADALKFYKAAEHIHYNASNL